VKETGFVESPYQAHASSQSVSHYHISHDSNIRQTRATYYFMHKKLSYRSLHACKIWPL